MNANFAQALAAAADVHPHRDCLILDDGTSWSYADLAHWSQRMAGALRNAGAAPGDRVLVQVDKSADAVALYLGCLRIGAIFVPLNTAYTPQEVRYFLDDAEPAVYVCRAGETASPGARATRLTLGADGSGTLAQAARDAEPFTGIEPRAGGDVAAIVYTSGTTGRSKGAMLTHDNLASSARTLISCWGWRDDDVLLHALPIFHVHGLFVALHCALLTATPMIFMAQFDAAAVSRAFDRATVMMGVPTFYTRLLQDPQLDGAAAARMRLFVSGSAPLTEATFAAWEERTGHRILERYGMSETMMNTSNPLDGERVPGSVGFALPGVEIRVTDRDGRPLATDEIGMIEVRGPNLFSGYWRMPEKTAEEMRADGFFITGDLGRMDAQGRVYIVGRSKDLVISGGYNVYPKEIEQWLDRMPEVRESAVIGVPHPDFGEAVVAVVVPADAAVTDAEVRAALLDRLARFKQPKAVVNVEALPRNAMGKVQKNVLREQFAELFEAP